jgi:probable HAF family extracellular repeat protein
MVTMSKLKLLVCLPLLFLVSRANSVAQPSYTTTDLGTLGGASSYSYRMSDTGQVVGQADTATETHAFLYDSTHGMVDLGTLGGTFSMANGIRGNYVVGRSTIAGDANTHAFVYNLQTLAMQDIHTLIGATGGDSSAISLNSSGLVVGAMVMADGTTHAFLYNIANGANTDLHPLLAMGGSYDTAYDINDAGQIVGSAGNDALAGYAGFMYDTNTAKVTSLASLSGDSSAAIINSSAQIVGAVRNSSNAVRALLWKNGAMADLGDLGGGFANAESININGVVVGESSISGGSAFAFKWDAVNGMVNLNTLNSLAAMQLFQANDINGSSQIVGFGYIGSSIHAFLLDPPGLSATLTLTSGLNPSYVGQSVTLSVLVSGAGATPTGSVAFKEGTAVLGTVTLTDGRAGLTTTFPKSGTSSIVASYSGDGNYKSANSGTLKQVVKQYTTGTALASSLNPSIYGQAVTLTATVSSIGPTPTGTVAFKNGTASLGSATISAGVAKLTKSTLPAGTLTVTASYAGDAAHKKSTSPPVSEVVNKAASKTVIVSSMNPSATGQTVKFTATLTSSTTKPTGAVTFIDGSTVLGTGTVAVGKASYSTSTLIVGSHNITAVYEGTANISGSTSPVLVQTVN